MSFTRVRNDFLERRDLSAVEKLILVWVAGRFRQDGKPWEINADQIRIALNLGHDSTDGALAKLKVKGWLTDNRKRRRDPATGRMVRDKSVFVQSRHDEIVFSQVRPEPGNPDTGKPDILTSSQVGPKSGFPGAGNPDRDIPEQESPTVINDCPMNDSQMNDNTKAKQDPLEIYVPTEDELPDEFLPAKTQATTRTGKWSRCTECRRPLPDCRC